MSNIDDAVAACDEVLDEWEGHIGTHHAECWRYHVACFAALMRNMLTEP